MDESFPHCRNYFSTSFYDLCLINPTHSYPTQDALFLMFCNDKKRSKKCSTSNKERKKSIMVKLLL